MIRQCTMRPFRCVFLLFLLPSILLLIIIRINAFEWSAGSRAQPEVNRQAIAGIWKLTPIPLPSLPMKEFTVYPKKKQAATPVPPELLLLLKEDGSFQQYEAPPSMRDVDENTDIDTSWRTFRNKQQQQKEEEDATLLMPKGTWALVDGNLILAADRPEIPRPSLYSTRADGARTTASAIIHPAVVPSDEEEKASSPRRHRSVAPSGDTLLKGRLVAHFQTRLLDNPILSASLNGTTTTDATTTTTSSSSSSSSSPSSAQSNKIQFDTHLSVPRGSIHVGKFFYPKHHPSFFEQPMFQPIQTGAFSLRQILGHLNTAQSSSDDVGREKYQRSDFYNKTFLLTSHPLRSSSSSQSSSSSRWSKNPRAAKKPEGPTSAVRVLQVAFYRNNTFSTTGGLGGAAILRGKFDIIGAEKDHLWMQVMRFGFGRSVSGSVYSEGPMLSHEDVKAYWGLIQSTPTTRGKDARCQNATTDDAPEVNTRAEDATEPYRIEVEGSVLDGLGLEPMPVGRFILKEIDATDLDEEDDDDDEEEDEIRRAGELASPEFGSDGIDWSSSANESFQ